MGGVEDEDFKELPVSEEDELVRRINKDIRESDNHIREWLTESELCYDYYAGNQWSEEDAAELEEQDRPVIVFNRTLRTVNAVEGLEIQNRQEVRYLPRETSDNGVAEVATSAAKWVRDNCDAEDEESEAFEDMIVCGMGWTETRVEYDNNLNGEINIGRTDPLCMRWDPNAKKRNLDDRRWNAYLKDMTKEEFKELWPDFEPQISTSYTDSMSNPHDATMADLYLNDQGDNVNRPKPVRVIQYQWWEREMIYRVVDRDGNVLGFETSKFDKIKDYVEAEGLKYIKQPRKVYKQAFVNGNQLLEVGNCPVDGFTFRCMTGYRNRNKNTYFGLVSVMRDPQMWANKWLSQIMNIINSNAKGGLMYESGAFRSLRDAQEQWAKPNGMIELNPGALAQGKIQQREAPRYPEGVDRLLQYSIQAVNDTVGVNLELLGVANRDQAGYLEAQRKEAGVTILAKFFDSLRRYRKEQGRILFQFIKNYISDGRLIRIVGQDGAAYTPLMKDQFTAEYDIIVDDSPTSPNMKEKVFGIISTLLPTLIQAGIPIPPEILEYAPIPESLKEKWKAMLSNSQKEQQQQQMQAITMQIAQLDAAKKEKEVAKTESETVLNIAKAKQAAATGEDEAAQAANKLGIAHAEQANKNALAANESSRKEREMIVDQWRKDRAFEQEQAREDARTANEIERLNMAAAARDRAMQKKGNDND